jgi:hypothetical protein
MHVVLLWMVMVHRWTWNCFFRLLVPSDIPAPFDGTDEWMSAQRSQIDHIALESVV